LLAGAAAATDPSMYLWRDSFTAGRISGMGKNQACRSEKHWLTPRRTGYRFHGDLITLAPMNRREFLRAASAAFAFAGPYQRLASAYAGNVKITGVKFMIVRGTWDWNLIKIETDSGLYGIGEAYWGWGVKDLVLNKLAPI